MRTFQLARARAFAPFRLPTCIIIHHHHIIHHICTSPSLRLHKREKQHTKSSKGYSVFRVIRVILLPRFESLLLFIQPRPRQLLVFVPPATHIPFNFITTTEDGERGEEGRNNRNVMTSP